MSSTLIRSAILTRAVGSLSALAGVDAIYLSGSLAEGTEDEHSDIDLRVVVLDAAYESVLALRETLPTGWGPFLFHQTVADNLTVTYYDSLTKADVFYFRVSSVHPSPWFNLGTKILFERSGALRKVIAESRNLDFAGTAEDVVRHLQRCIAGLIEGVKRVQRGETIYASKLMAEAVHNLFIADDLMSHRAPLGSSKRESLVPGVLSALAASHLGAPAHQLGLECFYEFSTAALGLVKKADACGFCPDVIATRLTGALAQLMLLSAGK